MMYLKQNLSDSIVFWKEDDVETQILRWCILQNKTDQTNIDIVNPNSGYVPEDGSEGAGDSSDDISDGEDEIGVNDDNDSDLTDESLFDNTDFKPIEITPILIGKTHATIEAATAMVNEKEFSDREAKEILIKLCKEYPVVCSAVMKLLGGS